MRGASMPEPAAAALVAVLTAPPAADGRELRALPPAVSCLEVRADRLGDLDPDWLRDHFAGELLYTLRSAAEGGDFAGSREQRRSRLMAAAARYDLVDLEGARDLDQELLSRLPASRRVLSWHGGAATAADATELARRFDELAGTAARLYRLGVSARDAADALAPLAMLAALRRPDVTAIATGPAGSWSRLLAALLGAPIAFGAVADGVHGTDGDGAFTAARLVSDFGLPGLPRVNRLFGIVGPAVGRSLSPRLHNDAYRRLGLPALYVPFQVEDLRAFLEAVEAGLEALGMPLCGLTVTAPYKESALGVADTVTPLARRAGAANTMLRHGGAWQADTADALGVVAALGASRIAVAGRQAAVVGCGGAGRAAAAGLQQAGASVTLVNRGQERGEHAARLLGLPFVPLAGFTPRGYALVVNATSCTGAGDDWPFLPEELDPDSVLVDLPYASGPTPLAAATAARGRTTIDGREVLLVEAQHQFELMTGQRMAAGPARALIEPGGVSFHATIDSYRMNQPPDRPGPALG
jgi:3-dehydroquinate dehydratase/shikimate dehydrogenase